MANPAGQPVTPSEFTFYETLKKPSQDPAATVGLTNPKASATPAPSSKAAPPPAQAPKPAVKPHSRVIETATAQDDALRYTVQVGAFREQPVAERLIADLNRKGHTAYLMTAPVEDGMTYRVRVGKFATKEEADQVAKQLAAQEGLHPFVATIQPNS
jgi:DedD protein